MIEEEIKIRLRYDPTTGCIYWIPIPENKSQDIVWNLRFAEKVAGTKSTESYKYIHLTGRKLLYHRVVWFLHHGRWPSGEIDHLDRDKHNNKINNLREVTHKVNNRNLPKFKTNTSGLTGVYFHKIAKKWCARIKINGRGKHLGLFVTKDEAYQARLAAEKLYGFHKTHGKSL